MDWHFTKLKKEMANKVEDRLIALEGIGGCGKGTQAKMLATALTERGKKVLVTCEHTRHMPAGALVERVIKGQEEKMDPLALQILYSSDRRDHFMRGILPSLDSVDLVILDRFYASTVAYTEPECRKLMLDFNQEIVPRPGVTFFLDVRPEVAVARVHKRGDPDFFDKAERLAKCREGYLWYLNQYRDHCVAIDGEQSPEDIHQLIMEKLIQKRIISR